MQRIPERGIGKEEIGVLKEPATRLGSNEADALTGRRRMLWKAPLLVGACLAVAVVPAPAGLSPAGQRALVVAVLAVGLWCTEMLPAGVTGILVVVSLVLSRAVPGFTEALAGFADPAPYFLIGVLTIGLAVMRSGLTERVALLFLRRCGGRSRALYVQLLLTFPLLAFLLPSATTRTGILIHGYEQVLELGHAAGYILWLFFLIPIPLLSLTLLTRPKEFRAQIRLRWKAGFFGGMGTAASYGLALWAMTIAPIALVAGLRETSVIFGTVFAGLFLKERFSFLRYVAAGLVTMGGIAIKVF